MRAVAPSMPITTDHPRWKTKVTVTGELFLLSEHVTHDVLLRTGVNMVDYVCNTASLRQPGVLISTAPLKIPGADGVPARAYPIEGAI